MKNCKFLLGALLMILFVACSKDDNSDNEQVNNDEVLTAAENAAIESMPAATDVNAETVILPNGISLNDYLDEVDPAFNSQWRVASTDSYANLGPQDAKNLLIAKLSKIALNLIDRQKHTFPDEGDNKPAQVGFAYSWGNGIDLTHRYLPKQDESTCTDLVYGMDCSGFVYQLFKNAEVNIVDHPAEKQRTASYLQNAIRTSIPSLNKVKVEDLGQIPTSKFENGDVIYWLNKRGKAKHIGIVLKTGNALAVYQSNGVPGDSDDECSDNLAEGRGPRQVLLTNTYWFGATQKYGITRINADISGHWEFHFRCANQPNDYMMLNLDFPTTSINNFTINKHAIDYNGVGININLNFNYDNSTNILSCVYTMAFEDGSQGRTDKIEVKLTRDDTNYIGATKVVDNGGCYNQVRAINKE